MPLKKAKTPSAATLSLRKKRLASLIYSAVFTETGEPREALESFDRREEAKKARFLFCQVARAKGLSRKDIGTVLPRDRTVIYDYLLEGDCLQLTDDDFSRKKASCLASIEGDGQDHFKNNVESAIKKIRYSLAKTQETLSELERLLKG